MNEQDVRAMIRDAIARQTGAVHDQARPGPDAAFVTHASFVRLPLLRSGDDDGACLIEPAVRCNHCGYCQSYGH